MTAKIVHQDKIYRNILKSQCRCLKTTYLGLPVLPPPSSPWLARPARADFHITDKFFILAQGEIGGFGAGSNFTRQALAAANYCCFNDNFAVPADTKSFSQPR